MNRAKKTPTPTGVITTHIKVNDFLERRKEQGDTMKQTIAILTIALLVLGGCAAQRGPDGTGGTASGSTETGDTSLSGASQELRKFSSIDELRDYLAASQGRSANAYGGGLVRGAMMESMAMDAVAAPTAMKAGAPSPTTGGASDYSQTNVQVEGVDEADFVKNDGEHIYVLSGDNLVIMDAYPAESAEIVSKSDIDGRPRDMFVNGDRLVVFVDRNDYVYALPQYEIMPQPRYASQTHVIVYDITDRADPEIEREFTLDGNYLQSRMIGDHVYFLVRDDVRIYDYYPEMPVIREGTATVVKPDIYYFDNPEESYQFTTVASLDVTSGAVDAKSYLMGYASTIYASEEHLYVAYQRNLPWRHYEEEKEERFWQVIVPLLPGDVRSEVLAAKDSRLSEAEQWSEVSAILEEMYNAMSESAKEELLDEMNEAVGEWELRREEERQKTVIHKIAIDDGEIDYVARGEVPGQLLNQFSMDEHGGNLRVATTSYLYTSRKSTMHNNVYVLDAGMDVVGDLEGLAEEERIYATRFIGDRLYMVTFQRIDPLFVIDLANPRQPKVLGELKIPGYSDYLHPYDEDHLIGIGKETKENEWGGVSVKGVKLALFDVSDVTSPELVDSVEIGTSGSDSEALNDHKAFLFDREKELLVLPIREVKESYAYDGTRCAIDRCYPYRQRVWQGAYVFTVTPEGFERRGKVAHYDGDEEYSWYWGSPSAVRRSLFMDDVLYTVSQRTVMMHDLETVDEINAVKLPYSEPSYDYPRPMPFVGRGMEDVAVVE